MPNIETELDGYIADKLPFPHLFNELNDFGIGYSKKIKVSKATRIYRMCIKNKKFAIAKKIEKKYRLINDDMMMAVCLAFNYKK